MKSECGLVMSDASASRSNLVAKCTLFVLCVILSVVSTSSAKGDSIVQFGSIYDKDVYSADALILARNRGWNIRLLSMDLLDNAGRESLVWPVYSAYVLRWRVGFDAFWTIEVERSPTATDFSSRLKKVPSRHFETAVNIQKVKAIPDEFPNVGWLGQDRKGIELSGKKLWRTRRERGRLAPRLEFEGFPAGGIREEVDFKEFNIDIDNPLKGRPFLIGHPPLQLFDFALGARGTVYHDLDVVGPSCVNVFTQGPMPQMIEIWEYKFENDDGKKYVGTWSGRAAIDDDFRQPFWGFGRDGRYFIVTEAGSVYMAKVGDPNVPVKPTLLFRPDHQSRMILLEESETGVAHLFTDDQLVSLGEQVRITKCDVLGNAIADGVEMAERLRRCGRVVLNCVPEGTEVERPN